MEGVDVSKMIKQIFGMEGGFDRDLQEEQITEIPYEDREYYELSVTVYGSYDIKTYKIPEKSLNKIMNNIKKGDRECLFEEFVKEVYSALKLSDDFTEGVVIRGRFNVEISGNLENGLSLIINPVGTDVKMIVNENCPVVNRKELQRIYVEIVEEYIDTYKTTYNMEFSVFRSKPTLSFI